MTNLLTLLPDFHSAPYSHILPSLEKARITTADLLTLDASAVAKRAQVPPGEVKKLADALLHALHGSISTAVVVQSHCEGDELTEGEAWSGIESAADVALRRTTISTLDDVMDARLNGGIAAGHLTEIVGESAAGKTQFLLTLLLSVQLPSSVSATAAGYQPKSALYISTEAPLQTTRLTQILETHSKLATLSPSHRPSLGRVHSTHIHDVEAQEHILRFQVPVAIQKHNVGLLVVDSIAANYRAEFDKGGRARNTAEALAQRNTQLAQLGGLLRSLARTYNIAIVVANQVADRFVSIEPPIQAYSQSTQGARAGPPSQGAAFEQSMPAHASPYSILSTDDPLALDHQQRFFTGWGDDPAITNLKTPSLGLTWTNQLATRIALLKEPIYEVKAYAPGDERNVIGWKRACKVVFSASSAASMTDFEIWEGGVRSLLDSPDVDGQRPMNTSTTDHHREA